MPADPAVEAACAAYHSEYWHTKMHPAYRDIYVGQMSRAIAAWLEAMHDAGHETINCRTSAQALREGKRE